LPRAGTTRAWGKWIHLDFINDKLFSNSPAGICETPNLQEIWNERPLIPRHENVLGSISLYVP
jgi:hypothetical protein